MANFIYDMGFENFERLEELKWSLGYAIARGLFMKSDSELFIDYTGGDKSFSGLETLSIALGMRDIVAKATQKPRIGIALPPSLAAAAANYACVFCGKTPVNLNFTMGPAAAKSCMETAGIDTVLTLEFMRKKIADANPHFPWPEKVLDVSECLLNTAARARIGGMGLEEICAKYGIDRRAGNRGEGTLIFTSGSEGAPKAAVLTGRNIIANSTQVRISEVFAPNDLLLGNLPVFHSFGLLFEVWHAAIAGQRTLLLASPIDIKTNLRAIRERKPTVMIGSPTFFRAYVRHADSGDLKSLRRAIAGAEKTPHGFHETWDAAFGGQSYKEGYGLTEATPVVGVNLDDKDFGWFTTGTRRGSIGKLFPGMQARILHPGTREPLPWGEQGLLSLRGANVFAGYLGREDATKEALDGEWLVTGDLSRLDKDGFLYVDGRLSRFSKIGGEMVPHATVEAALAKALGLDGGDIPLLAVSARLDEDKGEALVLVSAVDIELHTAREKLREAGISNLWMPKYVVRTESIPLLPSGKLDLKALARLAAQDADAL